MKPNTRLLIRVTLPNGDQKSWGYDYPHYKTIQQLHESISADFLDFPKNIGIHLFYNDTDDPITVSNGIELADTAIGWLKNQGVFF